MKKTEGKQQAIKIYIVPILCIAILTATDQLTKYIVTGRLALYESKPAIKNVLSFTYIRNSGVAWGMFAGKRILFLILTFLVLLLCFYVYTNIAEQRKYLPLRIGMVVLIAGAVGNMIDRIKLGYVVDFLCLEFIDFPIFNVADIFVTLSMIFIFVLIMFKYDNDEFDEILGMHTKKKMAADEKTERKQKDTEID